MGDSILQRMKNRNEAFLRNNLSLIKPSQAPIKSLAAPQALPQPAQSIQPNQIGNQVLVFEEQSSVLNGGKEEEEKGERWFDSLRGGDRKEAMETEKFLVDQLALTREETNKAQANSLLVQQQLTELQIELDRVRSMVQASTKNVEESTQILNRVQDASLEINRTRSEMVLIQQETASAALRASSFKKNAESAARTAQDAVTVQTIKKTRIMHGELERALKLEEDLKKKSLEGHRLLDEEQKVLDRLRVTEKQKRDDADSEEGRYSKLKSYAEILVMNAQTATVAAGEANEKLAFLLANEKKAQETLTKYKEHAKAVIQRSKKFESDAINSGKRDQETLQKINEIHAYETETATVLIATMKLIEKLREKIEKALARAKEAEASALQKANDAKKSQDTLIEYESVLKKALSDAVVALRELRDEEVKIEKVRSDATRYDDEYERAKTDARIKSSATIESENEARNALREMQASTTAATANDSKQLENKSESEDQPREPRELSGGARSDGVFSKITRALQSLKKKNIKYVSGENFQKSVADELAGEIKVNF
jgi:hypothetical protein